MGSSTAAACLLPKNPSRAGKRPSSRREQLLKNVLQSYGPRCWTSITSAYTTTSSTLGATRCSQPSLYHGSIQLSGSTCLSADSLRYQPLRVWLRKLKSCSGALQGSIASPKQRENSSRGAYDGSRGAIVASRDRSEALGRGRPAAVQRAERSHD